MLLAAVLFNPEKGESAEIRLGKPPVYVYYRENGKTCHRMVESKILNAEIRPEKIRLNSASYPKLSEWSISSPKISWFGGRSMAYAAVGDKVFGFFIEADLYITPSISGSANATRNEIPKLRAMAETQAIRLPLNLSIGFRSPGYETMGLDNRLRIADIEIFDDKLIVVLENRLKSKIPVTINVPEMTLREVGAEF